MEYDIKEKTFAMSMESLASFLPRQIDCSEDEMHTVEIPGRRYDEIREAVLKMYQDVDAHVMPLPVFDIVYKLGCALVSYRALGRNAHDVLMSASPDAVLLHGLSLQKTVIFYNDNKQISRINYSLMHEVGHLRLDHREHCPLAEKEANYFAAVALCPSVMLEEYGITSVSQIVRHFDVSAEFARNRIAALKRRREKSCNESERDRAFRNEVLERFHFRNGIQMELFSYCGRPMKEIA